MTHLDTVALGQSSGRSRRLKAVEHRLTELLAEAPNFNDRQRTRFRTTLREALAQLDERQAG